MKPSASKLSISNKIPRSSEFPELTIKLGSKSLKITIPPVTINPNFNFYDPNFNYFPLTLEKYTPMIITFNRLQDLVIITKG